MYGGQTLLHAWSDELWLMDVSLNEPSTSLVCLALNSLAWTLVQTVNSPGGRLYHSAASCGAKMLLFGGENFTDEFDVRAPTAPSGTMWEYDAIAGTWTVLASQEGPAITIGRTFHSTVIAYTPDPTVYIVAGLRISTRPQTTQAMEHLMDHRRVF